MNRKIWLIRHAESESNAGLRTTYPKEISLSPLGFEQANKLAKEFSLQPDLIINSPYLRAKQTAEALAIRYPKVPMEEWAVQEFTYLSPNKYKNTTTIERIPMVMKYWEAHDPLYYDGDGAESFTELIKRVQATIEKLKKRKEKFITLFSHEEFIAAILWVLNTGIADISSDKMREYRAFLENNRITNCGIREVTIKRRWLFASFAEIIKDSQ